jgi:hypothetical protein
MNLRQLHRRSAPFIFVPLLVTALTGLTAFIGTEWFKMSDEFGDFMMSLHEGRFLGKPLVPIYILLVGIGLLGMIVTGIGMLKKQFRFPSKFHWRSIHQFLAPIAMLPLLVSIVTGVGYRLGRNWLNVPKSEIGILLKIHQGLYFGSVGQSIYILLLGISLITLIVTGMQMTGIFRKRGGNSAS